MASIAPQPPAQPTRTISRRPVGLAQDRIAGQNEASPLDRKPVGAAPTTSGKEARGDVPLAVDKLAIDAAPNQISQRPGLSLETTLPANITDSAYFASPTSNKPDSASVSASTSRVDSATGSFSSTFPTPKSSQSSTGSSYSQFAQKTQKAFEDVRHHAGGLLSHPYEYTKHFTILRHTQGLVFYQGSNTTLAISIFADAPLPAGRTLWLQNKGWTGKTGMRLKATLGRNSGWLDVTPTTPVGTAQLAPSDERAWQRDLKKFARKAPEKIRHQTLRETAVLRIPAEAGDGYFQVVMCLGNKKKTLCTSPSFRLFSASTSPSSLRGASLSTLPLEIGAMVLGAHAQSTVSTAVAPVTSAVQNYMPSYWEQTAATAVYDGTGMDRKVNDAEQLYMQRRDLSLLPVAEAELILEKGPVSPYPINFSGHSEHAPLKIDETSDKTVFGLTGVADGVTRRLYGYYFGWARKFEKSATNEPWSQVIISSLPVDLSQSTKVTIAHANRKEISIRLTEDFEEMPSDRTLFEVQVLGFIRPNEPAQRLRLEQGLRSGLEEAHEAATISAAKDVSMAQQYLSHPAWSPETMQRPNMETRQSGLQKVQEGYTKTRLAAQKQIDKVPLSKMGIRLDSDKLKDQAFVTNGFYVVR